MIQEEKATMETSVDANTRISLFKWINQGVFDRIYGVIATGKVRCYSSLSFS